MESDVSRLGEFGGVVLLVTRNSQLVTPNKKGPSAVEQTARAILALAGGVQQQTAGARLTRVCP